MFSGTQDHGPQTMNISIYPGLEHNLVFAGEKKICVMCQMQRRRTKAGWQVYSRHKCDKCDVSLCRSGLAYDCFKLYHEMTPGSVVERGKTIQTPLMGTTKANIFTIPDISRLPQNTEEKLQSYHTTNN